MFEPLEILYQDEHLVIINKPNGLLVHRSPLARDVTRFAMQEVRDQIGQYVYPVHRLDRKTSGVLAFGLTSESAREISTAFTERKVSKEYMAIVRGFFPEESFTLDYALTNDKGVTQEAVTRFEFLETTEIDVPFGRYNTSRYSLIKAYPETGRLHQIRKHLAHLRHPIIGDRPHGCNKQNKLFKEKWDMMTMMLHAERLTFTHPVSGALLEVKASLPGEFLRVADLLGLSVPK